MTRIFLHEYIRPVAVLFFIFTVLLGFLYPGITTLLVQGLFAKQANGSMIYSGDKLMGSELIGQNFSGPRYFWGRLSATVAFPYNSAASSGSNLGVNNPILQKAVKARLDQLKPKEGMPVPVDLVTASASGLDPDISVASAYYQIPRVAKARGMDEAALKTIVDSVKEGRQFGFLGEQRVNVLKLNLALDSRLTVK